MQGHQREPYVVAFEPAAAVRDVLTIPAHWSQYARTRFEFSPLFVGATSNDTTVALDQFYGQRPFLHGKPSLIKVDVEGAEIEVLHGARLLLEHPHQWVVEVHGDQLLDPVLRVFSMVNRAVEVVPLKPHWLLGPETRVIPTCWVTTR